MSENWLLVSELLYNVSSGTLNPTIPFFLSGEENEKSDPESKRRSGSPPKVNHF